VNLNAVWLDQGTAVVVLANEDGSSAPRTVTNQIAPLLLREAQDHTLTVASGKLEQYLIQ
jgi:hypothetical protein